MLAMFLFALSLQLTEIELGGKKLTVELADTPKARKTGAMGRESMGKDRGILFVYQKPRILFFWMKGTNIPLSIGFFDEEKTLLNVEEMKPAPKSSTSFPLYHSTSNAQYALEMPSHWFKKNGVSSGSKFKFINK